MRSKTSAPVAFICGLTTGIAAGILFAPHKGKITRAKIKQSIDEGVERAEEQAHAAQAKAKAAANKFKK